MTVVNKTLAGEGMFLLPPARHLCQTCGTDHEAVAPHNAQSLFYQTKFYMEHGRAATWLDAMAHCAEPVRTTWRDALIGMGVDVDGGALSPRRTA